MNLRTIEKRQAAIRAIKTIDGGPDCVGPWWFLCDPCPWVNECEWAFDLYNVETPRHSGGGWCLADK